MWVCTTCFWASIFFTELLCLSLGLLSQAGLLLVGLANFFDVGVHDLLLGLYLLHHCIFPLHHGLHYVLCLSAERPVRRIVCRLELVEHCCITTTLITAVPSGGIV